jgi:hypothetical protein
MSARTFALFSLFIVGWFGVGYARTWFDLVAALVAVVIFVTIYMLSTYCQPSFSYREDGQDVKLVANHCPADQLNDVVKHLTELRKVSFEEEKAEKEEAL